MPKWTKAPEDLVNLFGHAIEPLPGVEPKKMFGYPQVLSTSQLSVGLRVSVKHTAATPVGSELRAVATYLGEEGKLFRFKVEAFDEAGSLGEGEHLRAIIATERLLAGAAKRKTGERP
jgi:predicted thioesterase